MKNKKIILLLIFSLGFVLANIVIAADKENTTPLEFIPSMTIPGLYTAGEPFLVDGSSLAKYIVGIYRYGGMFAGVVAMFMLVYAGWEWLLAGGNSSKISSARDKINSTLIGLALLFGGYILLSLISQRLVSFEPLNRDLPKLTCSVFTIEKSCPAPSCKWVKATPEQIALDATATGKCLDTTAVAATAPSTVIDCLQIEFPISSERTYSSSGYEGIRYFMDALDEPNCRVNACYGKNFKNGTSPLGEVCYWSTICSDLRTKSCSSNSDCQIENNPDSRTWCCEDIPYRADKCAPVGGEWGIDASRCGGD
ncbi:MAG: hypothetical protein WCV69_01680 [Patescibacteria group bacterium]|jgi:hypothetical protein